MFKEQYDNRGIPIRKFVGAVYEHMIAGMPKVDDQQYVARLAICDSCEHCDKSNDRWICKLCQCYLKEGSILPGKARWGSENCPIDKWPKLTLPTITNSASSPCCGQTTPNPSGT